MSDKIAINFEFEHTPRHMRTPITEAAWIFSGLDIYLNDLVAAVTSNNEYIDYISDIIAEINNDESITANSLIDAGASEFKVSAAYALQALKAYKPENKDSESERLAWTFIADAQNWMGMALGRTVIAENHRAVYDKASTVRHSKNRESKKIVFEYYEANIGEFKSKDQAAEAIAGSIVKLSFRTVRSYISEYHKKKTVS
jgi:hypothetical protein